MNSPFVVEQAKSLAMRPDFQAASTEQRRLHLLYEWAFQREPTREEIELADQFIHSQTNAPAPAGLTNWLFGYGAFDDASNRVKEFHKLPYYDGHAFQGGATLPDAKLAWVTLNATGGHPGNDQQHAAIRRWVAPRDGTIAITGTLAHPNAQGDGVRGRIVSSQLGVLGHWLVLTSNETETKIERVAVKLWAIRIDFVTDCYGIDSFDSFSWSPNIRLLADASVVPG